MDEFLRTRALIGSEAQERLRCAHIVVAGAGGVGGYCLEGLVRAGIGAITAVDGDVVSVTNCNRQLLALHSTCGRAKVLVARERMLDINPRLRFEAVREWIGPDTLGRLPAQADYIVDCIDDTAAKLLLASFCRENRIPFIMCMGTGNRLSAQGLRIVNFDQTAGCPLAKKMRGLLRKAQYQNLRVLYSADPVLPAYPIGDGGKQTVGSISFVPSAAGLKLAEHVCQRLIGQSAAADIPE